MRSGLQTIRHAIENRPADDNGQDEDIIKLMRRIKKDIMRALRTDNADIFSERPL